MGPGKHTVANTAPADTLSRKCWPSLPHDTLPPLRGRCCGADRPKDSSAQENSAQENSAQGNPAAPPAEFDDAPRASCGEISGSVAPAAGGAGAGQLAAIFVAARVSGVTPPLSPEGAGAAGLGGRDTGGRGKGDAGLQHVSRGGAAGGVLVMAETDFTVTPVLPETEYLVWASRKRGAVWGPWSLPQSVTTAAANHAPDPPAVPILGTALGCHEIAVRVPALAVHGCAAARNVEMELRQAGGADSDWHEVDGVMGEDEATLTVKRLDPARAYEFRAVAHNRHGSTPGNSTGKVSGAVAPLGALSAPHVAGTSSQTISVDWSHLSTGCAVPPWCARSHSLPTLVCPPMPPYAPPPTLGTKSCSLPLHPSSPAPPPRRRRLLPDRHIPTASPLQGVL